MIHPTMIPRVVVDAVPAVLIEETIARHEGQLSANGALVVNTGIYTGRSPADRFIVADTAINDLIWWGDVNRPIERHYFTGLMHKVQVYLAKRDTYVLHASANADVQYTVDWPLSAGETVRDLASLFYPKNQRMQQYFIAETIKLNMEAQPELHPSTIFSQDNVIVIPNIKELSKKSARRVARRN